MVYCVHLTGRNSRCTLYACQLKKMPRPNDAGAHP